MIQTVPGLDQCESQALGLSDQTRVEGAHLLLKVERFWYGLQPVQHFCSFVSCFSGDQIQYYGLVVRPSLLVKR